MSSVPNYQAATQRQAEDTDRLTTSLHIATVQGDAPSPDSMTTRLLGNQTAEEVQDGHADDSGQFSLFPTNSHRHSDTSPTALERPTDRQTDRQRDRQAYSQFHCPRVRDQIRAPVFRNKQIASSLASSRRSISVNRRRGT